MQPRFIELPEKKFVGLGAAFISMLSPDRNTTKIIPALWHRFIQRQAEISNRVGQTAYGLVMPLPAHLQRSHQDEMFYVVCTEVTADVTQGQLLPAGMITSTAPAGRYAVFTHRGKLDGLGKTSQEIYTVWLPANRSMKRPGPDIEWYDQRFDPESDASEFDILLPVK